MKLNAKLYKNLTSEPFLTQTINGQTIQFYYMNDTQYLFQFASKGRFAVWATDGFNYKVLIERKYYEAMQDFYEEDVNQIWVNFLTRVSKINKKINTFFIVPTMILYAAIAFIASVYLQEYMLQILLGLLGVIIVSNMIQNRLITKRVRAENLNAQNEIRDSIGHEAFDKLIASQQEHYQEYFKFEEPAPEEPITEEITINQENSTDENNSLEDNKEEK